MPELRLRRQFMGRPVVHFEIGCRDKARTSDFFGKLFDWKTQEMGPATLIDTGSGITGHITSLGHEPHHYVTVYIEVDDVQAYLDKAVALGGKALLPVIPIPQGEFSWFSDPDGNTIGLMKSAKKATGA
jgi:uncharacterized protein